MSASTSAPPSRCTEEQLAERAGLRHGPLEGNIARTDHRGASGWVIDRDHPGLPVALDIVADGVLLARVLADHRRPDLEMAGIGNGRCAFAVTLHGAAAGGPRPCGAHSSRRGRRRCAGLAAAAATPARRRRRRERIAALIAGAASTDAGRIDLAGVLARAIDRLVQARIEGGIFPAVG